MKIIPFVNKSVLSYVSIPLFFAVLFSCKTSKTEEPITYILQGEDNKTFYAMGHMLGENLTRLKLSTKELENLTLGMKHAANNEKPLVEIEMYRAKIQDLFKSRMDSLASFEKNKGKKFIEEYKLKDGVVITESGLAYRVLKEGTGATPLDSSTVEVHYHGTLIDGTVFDSSVDRGKKISFPLDRVIKGWGEGVQTMKVGGKTEFVIPSDIAYGDAGAPPEIPGGATLIFVIELFDVR